MVFGGAAPEKDWRIKRPYMRSFTYGRSKGIFGDYIFIERLKCNTEPPDFNSGGSVLLLILFLFKNAEVPYDCVSKSKRGPKEILLVRHIKVITIPSCYSNNDISPIHLASLYQRGVNDFYIVDNSSKNIQRKISTLTAEDQQRNEILNLLFLNLLEECCMPRHY